ncbi:N-acetyl-gamma-glutamyl-phosphate reductase [Cytobacillus kochii]|uniref:N-acetyl-gamma-glutamyl-phosphate reductase n=1 Tax=Cytobacillus TaxID=2675230 RepID=UPI002AFF9497|nr:MULTISPECIES: N-acetyl-gamma-glutamyl-phosphate reductase [Cytobacillus]MEA1851635.1 N-acetyl-gamma-glutamyl-phosphate reductase [Cytobacillus sp. OWB-43]MED1605703.1 N-acetyl-gamma-glutamyl-phosphate reductase [Cytobacillus kochii]
MKASIIGTTGYGGAELLRILKNHPEFEISSIHSTRDNLAISDEYPHLIGIMNNQLQKIEPEKISESADIVFLATPSGVSGELAAQFVNKNIKIVDLSGDLRLPASEYKQWYKKDPTSDEVINQAVYGLTEWNRDQVKTSDLISNPGCYPTATLLGLAPVVIEQLIEKDQIIVDAKSGISGAGRSLSRTSSFAEANENFSAYKVNQHQHTPEIEQQLKVWNKEMEAITFTTQLLPITRGIMATSYVKLKENYSTKQLVELYEHTYQQSPFVRVRPVGNYPSVKEVAGSNYCDIGLHVDERTGRMTIISVIDNLMKGAAGQAVQNANLMFGMEETTGLEMSPLYP